MFNKLLLQQCADSLYRQHQTLAVAESVTAGLLQVAFASTENASIFFQGGLTAYNAKQKFTHLHVDITHALSCNCVSNQVAEEMAAGAGKYFLSDWGIGVTGYASPLPGHEMNQLFAFYAFSFRNTIVKSGTVTCNVIEPLQVQMQYVNTIVEVFAELLTTEERKHLV